MEKNLGCYNKTNNGRSSMFNTKKFHVMLCQRFERDEDDHYEANDISQTKFKNS